MPPKCDQTFFAFEKQTCHQERQTILQFQLKGPDDPTTNDMTTRRPDDPATKNMTIRRRRPTIRLATAISDRQSLIHHFTSSHDNIQRNMPRRAMNCLRGNSNFPRQGARSPTSEQRHQRCVTHKLKTATARPRQALSAPSRLLAPVKESAQASRGGGGTPPFGHRAACDYAATNFK